MTYINSARQLGQILIARRKTLGLSQQQLAGLLGISQNRLSELESEPLKLTLDRLMVILNVLKLELDVRERSSTHSRHAEW